MKIRFHYVNDMLRIKNEDTEYFDTVDNFIEDYGSDVDFTLPDGFVEIRVTNTLGTIHTRDTQRPIPENTLALVDLLINSVEELNEAKTLREAEQLEIEDPE